MGGVYDKDGGPMLIRFGGRARLTEDINDELNVLIFHANEERDVAPSQKAAGAGDTGHAVVAGYQLFDHWPGVHVTDDGND